jgi:hypothetical protein
MNLIELQDEVYKITNRPDLVAETLSAIRSATLRAHQLEFFEKDVLETGIVFPTFEYIQQLEYRTYIPRYRKYKYIRRFDITGDARDGAKEFFTHIPPENALDEYHINRENVYYLAGSVIQIRCCVEFNAIIFGCYLNPDITESGFNSWIALDHPWAIIHEASALIFKMIGKKEEESSHKILGAEHYKMLQMSNIETVGV